MVVVDDLAQRVGDRGDLARLDVLKSREDQRAVLREQGDIGEIGFSQDVIGDARRLRLMLRRHEQVGIGCFASLTAAEVQSGGGRGINDSDLFDVVVDRNQRRGVGDGIFYRIGGKIGRQTLCVIDQGGKIDRGRRGPAGRRQQRLRDREFDALAIAGKAVVERRVAVEFRRRAGGCHRVKEGLKLAVRSRRRTALHTRRQCCRTGCSRSQCSDPCSDRWWCLRR